MSATGVSTGEAVIAPITPKAVGGGQTGFASRTLRRRIIRTFARNRLGLLGVVLVLTFVVVALFASILGLQDPLAMNGPARFSPPSPSHWFGTDEFGRDLLSRLIYGSRISLGVGAAAVMTASVIGVPLGLLAGYAGGVIDVLAMRLLDVILAFPPILLAMAIVAVLGANAVDAMLAVAIVSIPVFSRLARASTLAQKQKEYVEAARALGATHSHIMFRTILPNTLGPAVVQLAICAASAVLLEATLSFLGLGIKPPDPSWGTMLSTGRGFLHQAPWYGLFPGLFLTALVLSLNWIVDVLQEVLDPTRQVTP